MSLNSRRFNKQKAFGQHFLKDQKVIDEIVNNTLQVEKDARSLVSPWTLLEIGPGQGAITHVLLKSIAEKRLNPGKLVLAEKDFNFIKNWKEELNNTSVSHLVLEGDFLETAPEWFKQQHEQSVLVVSNLPYSTGTAILLLLDQFKAFIPEMILMFQAEVSQKLYALPSTSKRGSLSVWIQNHWEVSKLCRVPPQAFNPPPRVDSEVVLLKKRTQPMIALHNEQQQRDWELLLKTAFKQRRKMLRGNFLGTPFEKAFQQSGVLGTLRAEALDWHEWNQIWEAYGANEKNN